MRSFENVFKFSDFNIIGCKILENAGHLEQKCKFFILLGLTDNNGLWHYDLISMLCSASAFQRHIDDENLLLDTDVVRK